MAVLLVGIFAYARALGTEDVMKVAAAMSQTTLRRPATRHDARRPGHGAGSPAAAVLHLYTWLVIAG